MRAETKVWRPTAYTEVFLGVGKRGGRCEDSNFRKWRQQRWLCWIQYSEISPIRSCFVQSPVSYDHLCGLTPIPTYASFLWTIWSLQTKHPSSYDKIFWPCPPNMAKVAKTFGNHHFSMWPIGRVSSLYPCFSLSDATIHIVPWVLGALAGLTFFIAWNHGWEEVNAIDDKWETWDLTA